MTDKRTVHALNAGLPLCNFSMDIPSRWPDGHVFTSVDDVENITCPKCVEAARMADKNRARGEEAAHMFALAQQAK